MQSFKGAITALETRLCVARCRVCVCLCVSVRACVCQSFFCICSFCNKVSWLVCNHTCVCGLLVCVCVCVLCRLPATSCFNKVSFLTAAGWSGITSQKNKQTHTLSHTLSLSLSRTHTYTRKLSRLYAAHTHTKHTTLTHSYIYCTTHTSHTAHFTLTTYRTCVWERERVSQWVSVSRWERREYV